MPDRITRAGARRGTRASRYPAALDSKQAKEQRLSLSPLTNTLHLKAGGVCRYVNDYAAENNDLSPFHQQ